MNTHSERVAVCCMVLAAGSGRRFGSDKRLALLPDGRRLLDATLASVPDIFQQRLLVLQEGDEALASSLTTDWTVVYAKEAKQGMGLSLAAGLGEVKPCKGVLVVLADMPHIKRDTFQTLTQLLEPELLVVPRYNGERGNPVGIGQHFFRELRDLLGDRGARVLLNNYPQAIRWVETDDSGVLRDVDVPADLHTTDSNPTNSRS